MSERREPFDYDRLLRILHRFHDELIIDIDVFKIIGPQPGLIKEKANLCKLYRNSLRKTKKLSRMYNNNSEVRELMSEIETLTKNLFALLSYTP